MNDQREAVVLVVDDDEVDRMAVLRALRLCDLQISSVEAATASEAVLQATVAKPDCIVLDYRLPTATGEEVLALLRSEGIDVPVIVLTGLGDERVAVKLMKAGVRDYLSKDEFTPEHLARSVSHAIRLHHAENASHRADARWRRHVAMLGQLAVVSPKLYAALTVEDLLDAAATAIRDLFNARLAFVLLRPRGAEAARFAVAGEALDDTHVEAGLPEGEAFWSSLESAPETLCIEGPCSSREPVQRLAAPIRRRDGSLVGAVAVDRCVDEEWEGEEADRAVLLQFSQMVSVAIENARLFLSERNAVLAREEILAIVSHDLRAPLGSIQLASSLLREILPQHEDEVDLVLDRMDAGVTHMQQLIEDLLDLARIDAGTLHVETAPTPVGQVVELATSLMASTAQRKRVSLEVSVEPQLPPVLADSKRVVQLLTNLLANAIKYSSTSACVSLTVIRESDRIAFAVKDQGQGLDEQDLAHLFERFWQAENRSKRGLGLGLYIAKAVVDAHGGRIWAERDEQGGACFRFTLPVASRAAVKESSRGARRAPDRP